VRFFLPVKERGCVEDQPQQPGCRLAPTLSNAPYRAKLLRIAISLGYEVVRPSRD